MAEEFLKLSPADKSDALESARSTTGRPPHLLEKDVWVVWALNAVFESALGPDLTFKGGTSLSKVYKIIDRFSEDIDLTYDIRRLISDLIDTDNAIPTTRSQASKWSDAVRSRLPDWIDGSVLPVVRDALARNGLAADVELARPERDSLVLRYAPVRAGTGYVNPTVVLEFGARSTGEPHELRTVTCDMASHLLELVFPVASPLVMTVARTFWEKATAAHVYCAQERLRGERYARHWFDIVALSRSPGFAEVISNRVVAESVAEHKSWFFAEKDVIGAQIDYRQAVRGTLALVPSGDSLKSLAEDYGQMIQDGILIGDAMSFDELMQTCRDIEQMTNRASVAGQ